MRDPAERLEEALEDRGSHCVILCRVLLVGQCRMCCMGPCEAMVRGLIGSPLVPFPSGGEDDMWNDPALECAICQKSIDSAKGSVKDT